MADLVNISKIKTSSGEHEINAKYWGGKTIDALNDINMEGITYSELEDLKNRSKLIKGKQYRITDYVTTTTQTNTQSENHQFDIVVTADGANSLSEVARSCFHDGDTYFSGVNLGAWELRYCFDNDTNRFAWADSVNGKGVIYYMKDEFGNEAPYDFKNIKFIYNSEFLTENANWKSAVLGQFTGTQLSFYTFSYYNAQSGVVDDSLKVYSTPNHYAHGNKINNYFRNEDGKLTLNNIVFVATENSPYNNIIENSCHDCIFGDKCYENTIGFDASSNVVGNKFYNNKIGSGFKNNKIYNTNKNSWFYSNILGNNCQNNIFPRQFYSCECGDNFINNDFFTNSSAPTASYVKNCIFGNNFGNNTGIHYKLSNIEILNDTLSGNWNDITVDNGKNINKCLSDYDRLGYFKLFIGLDENDRVFLRDFNEQCVYHMGHFTNLQLALQHAASVEIAGNESLSKICFTTGTAINNSPEALNEENHTGYIEQYVSRNVSTQVIFWQSGFRMRKITFTDNNRTTIDDNATTDSIKKGEGTGVYWSNPTSLYYDQASHKMALNRFDDGQKWGLSGCFGEVEIPLVSSSIAGLMSAGDKSLLTDTSALLNKFVKSKVYNSVPDYVGGDWHSRKRYWYRFAKINDKSPNIFRISTNAANDVIFTSSIGWSDGSSYDITGALSVINASLKSNENHACIEGIRLVASSSGGYIDMLLNTPYNNSSRYVEIYVTCISTIFNSNDYEPLYNNIEKLEEKGGVFNRNGETIIQSFDLVDKAIMSKDFILTNENGEQISVANSIADIIVNKMSPIQNISYSDLKDLRDNNNLTPGQKYRITDYVTTTSQPNTQSAGHQFDIIVEALSENALSEDAKAIQNENDGYFDEVNLEAWELKYCLDNDTSRFAWADDNGKGVIYYMKDEFNNECPYDFKNIQFVRYKLNPPTVGGYNNEWQNQLSKNVNKMFENNQLSYIWHGFDSSVHFWDTFRDVFSTTTGETKAFYTFSIVINDEITDKSLTNVCYSNVIKESYIKGVLKLNSNVFFSENINFNCHSNSFGDNCDSNSFGDNCYSNSFGDYCHSNSFGNECYSNTFGNECDSNTFGNGCYSNIFGNYFQSNSFGESCSSNSFGDSCNNNTFGNSCYSNSLGDKYQSNTFGNECYSNIFGENCTRNTFGNRCYSNIFGFDSYNNHFGNNCFHNIFGDECKTNIFGQFCSSNTFGQRYVTNTFGNYCRCISFYDSGTFSIDSDRAIYIGNGNKLNGVKEITLNDTCRNLLFYNNDGSAIQNITVNKGVKCTELDQPGDTEILLPIEISVTNNDYELKISKNSLGQIKIYCEADLIL